MFKRIGLYILAAGCAYGAAVSQVASSSQTSQENSNTVATGASQVTNDNTVAAPVAAPVVAPVSRFTEAELAAAAPAPVYTSCQKPGQFVITFDDGPNPKTTPRALQFLKEHNITATFFVNGINYGDVENSPATVELIKQEFNEGHEIASHTYYHHDLFEAIDNGMMEVNIDKMTDKIQEIIGVNPMFFRPPNGNGAYPINNNPEKQVKNEKIQKYLGASGYKIIMWGADTRDWEHKDNLDKIIEELNKKLKAPGVSPETHSFIGLMHDVHAITVDIVLPKVVEYISSLGYTYVSLSECLGLPSAYQQEALTNIDNSNLIAGDDLTGENLTGKEVDDDSSASIIQIKLVSSFIALILSLFFLL